MGYDPNFFGPPSWHILHTLAAHLLLLQSKGVNIQPYCNAYKKLVESMKKLVPCENCRKNYIINIRVVPIQTYGNQPINLFKWSCDLHNVVNQETGKPVYSFQEALAKYNIAPINQKYWCDPRNFEQDLWKMIHCIAGNMVMKQEESNQCVKQCIQEFVKFINALSVLIPCDDFRHKFLTVLNSRPLKNNSNNARQVFNWTVAIHSDINVYYKRPIASLPQYCKNYGINPHKKG